MIRSGAARATTVSTATRTTTSSSATRVPTRYVGGFGGDSITSGAGDDIVLANQDNDTVDTGNGTDIIVGGFGDDSISAGAGNDTLFGSEGNDTLAGGTGADRYVFLPGSGNDLVDGFRGQRRPPRPSSPDLHARDLGRRRCPAAALGRRHESVRRECSSDPLPSDIGWAVAAGCYRTRPRRTVSA